MNASAVNSPSIAIMIGFMSSLLVAVTVYAQWIVAAENAVVFRTSLGDLSVFLLKGSGTRIQG
jgi:hypothetical protein